MKQRIPKSLIAKSYAVSRQDCSICGDTYEVVKDLAHRYSTCSRECSTVRRSNKNSKVTKPCLVCSKEITLFPCKVRKVNTCGTKCRLTYLNSLPRKAKPVELRVRALTNKGYLRISNPLGSAVMEHRYVMEQKLGRKLTNAERVHHLNGVRTDNRPENLVVCATHAEHLRVWHPDLVHNLPNR